MKKYLNGFFFIAGSVVILFAACKKEETKIYYTGGTAPVLTASLSDSLSLVPKDSASKLVSFSWTNPNYTFTDGLSSQSVNYFLEFDTLGADFTSAHKQQVSISAAALDTTLTVGSINSIIGNGLLLSLGNPHSIQIRIKSFLGTGAAVLYSNAITYAVTPYAPPPKVDPPASGELYITGNALASDWTNTPPKATQQFTQVSPTLYTITVYLTAGNSYTFLPTYSSWNDKYSIAVKNDPTEVNGGAFQWQGNDILAPSTSGTYKIDVNFQTGIFTVTPQ